MPYQPILATLGYMVSEDGQAVLMIHRNARAHDPHFGKYNGLGGKLEADETVLEGLAREFQEEAGVVVETALLRGTLSWPGFGKEGEDWFGFVFLITRYQGTPKATNPEGTLAWVPLGTLLAGELPMWEGDRHFLPLVFDADERPFHGVMPYQDGRPVAWRYSRG